MSLDKTLQSAVDKAFKAGGDLLVSASLDKKEVSGFDFGSGSVISTSTTIPLQGFRVSRNRRFENKVIEVDELIVKTNGIEFSAYNTITLGGAAFTFSVSKSDKYTTTLELVRSV